MSKEKRLIVIVGPTAVGKTSLSVAIAKRLGAEIVSADSRQFYQEMNIGTAKPTPQEMDGVAHHFIDNISIHTAYNVGKYEVEVVDKLKQLFHKNDQVILTGGSGLYIDAVCEGLDKMPVTEPSVREQLESELESGGLDLLVRELREYDPMYFSQVDTQNSRRVIRALEVCRTTGLPYSHFRKKEPTQRPYNILKIGLSLERDELYKRIDDRVDTMIDNGLVDEVRNLHQYQHINALQTVGYKELFEYFDGKYEYKEAVRLIKRNTRRYAKRQMTWFRKDHQTAWYHPEDEVGIMRYLISRQ